MSDFALSLSDDQKAALLSRYTSRLSPTPLTYGTVRDFCDSAEHIPFLASLQGDLKDLQRPAALKAVLGLVQPGSSILEIGAGEPHVAHILHELGYEVTVVDPYDGSGLGPTEYLNYCKKYPDVNIIRSSFSDAITGIALQSFDCIYSISVLEHIHQPALSHVFSGIHRFLRKGGYSLHIIDHVLSGKDAGFHRSHLAEIVMLQTALASHTPARAATDLLSCVIELSADIDTYYLSAEGHNRWRNCTPYELFPFRRVVSVHSCVQNAKIETPPPD